MIRELYNGSESTLIKEEELSRDALLFLNWLLITKYIMRIKGGQDQEWGKSSGQF